jgi:hypothetical protein
MTYAVMSGLICLGGLVLCFKGFYRESYILVIGGWLIVIAAGSILFWWFVNGHNPITLAEAPHNDIRSMEDDRPA